ncbi:MAG: phage Gp37/Gp68 family protein, partial [Spartobacteria bacterium]|nr:phage Gp37/Gp68 family protein [Spartobacteria bacterium]
MHPRGSWIPTCRRAAMPSADALSVASVASASQPSSASHGHIADTGGTTMMTNNPRPGKKHKIGWLNVPGYTPETWNPIAGCSKISEGCRNCYAERMACRLAHMAFADMEKRGRDDESVFYGNTPNNALYAYPDVVEINEDGSIGGFDGTTRLVPSSLGKPLRWKKPRAIFVNSMGDLFHENTPDEWIAQVWGTMALCPQHLFLVLSKRAERMERWFLDENERCMANLGDGCGGLRTLPNVWIGVTAENQRQADARIPHLLRTPAAVRFVSCEPMIGEIDLNERECLIDKRRFKYTIGRYLDWVICGGESGPGARPMNPEWARSLRDQCVSSGTPFFFKQWG